MQVKRRGDDQKFIAEVLAIGTECDIALLTVHDNTFWEGVTPLELGSLPRLQVPTPHPPVTNTRLSALSRLAAPDIRCILSL